MFPLISLPNTCLFCAFCLQIQEAGDGSTSGLVELQGRLSEREAEMDMLRQALEQSNEAMKEVRVCVCVSLREKQNDRKGFRHAHNLQLRVCLHQTCACMYGCHCAQAENQLDVRDAQIMGAQAALALRNAEIASDAAKLRADAQRDQVGLKNTLPAFDLPVVSACKLLCF